jgi:hypothetical protein
LLALLLQKAEKPLAPAVKRISEPAKSNLE